MAGLRDAARDALRNPDAGYICNNPLVFRVNLLPDTDRAIRKGKDLTFSIFPEILRYLQGYLPDFYDMGGSSHIGLLVQGKR